ncbi:MAG: phage tail tape measure protein, partial [Gammaproteobacteria bacterium]|nr:phage tail tape measure protein [Gammaproteobacteria bacterium]
MAKTVGYSVKIDGMGAVTGGKQVTGAFRNIRGESQRTSRELQQLQALTGGLGGSMTSMAAGMLGPLGIVAGFGALSAGFFSASKAALVFEKAFAEVTTLLPQGSQEIGALNEGIREMAGLYGQGLTDTAKATYQIISAGATTAADAMSILDASNKLALGGVTDVKTAADGLTTILNAWGAAAGSVTEISDTLCSGMRAGKTTIAEQAESISYVASLAAQLDVSLQQVIAANAALTKGGIPTQRAMRGLAQVFASVIKPASEATKEAAAIGLEFSAAALQAKGLSGFLADVALKTQGSSESMAQLFGGVEALVPVLALTGKQAGDFTTILGDMATQAGATEEAVSKMTATDAFKLQKASAQWEIATTEIGDSLVQNILGPLEEAAILLMEAGRGGQKGVLITQEEVNKRSAAELNRSRLTAGMYQPEDRSMVESMLSVASFGLYQPLLPGATYTNRVESRKTREARQGTLGITGGAGPDLSPAEFEQQMSTLSRDVEREAAQEKAAQIARADAERWAEINRMMDEEFTRLAGS